jgi:hypothetical protein
VNDRYDDFDRALLRAGRRAVAPPNLRARAMSAAAAAGVATAATTQAAAATKLAGLAKVAKTLTVKWTLVAAVTTASVGTAVYVHETDIPAPAVETPPVATMPVTPSAAKAARVVAPVVAPLPAPAEPVETAVAAASSEALAPHARLRVVSPTPAAPPPTKRIDAFREELDLLDGARGALATGETSTALRLVEEHATRFPSGAFVVERDVIRIDALVAAGRTDEAVRSARKFLARHPGSAQTGRISKMVEQNP